MADTDQVPDIAAGRGPYRRDGERAAIMAAAPEWVRKADHLWSRHRMRAADVLRLWNEQQGRCYLCEELLDHRFVVDHDHSCTRHADADRRSCRHCWRGLAHQRCNVLVGTFGDDPERLRLVADNLEKRMQR